MAATVLMKSSRLELRLVFATMRSMTVVTSLVHGCSTIRNASRALVNQKSWSLAAFGLPDSHDGFVLILALVALAPAHLQPHACPVHFPDTLSIGVHTSSHLTVHPAGKSQKCNVDA